MSLVEHPYSCLPKHSKSCCCGAANNCNKDFDALTKHSKRGRCGLTTSLLKDSNALFLCFWSTSASPLRMHWRPGYLVPSVWGSTSGLPTEEERRALLSIVVAIPGYLLSGSSGHTSEPCVPSTALAPLLFSPPLLLRVVALSLYSNWLCISLCSSSCFLQVSKSSSKVIFVC